MGAVACATPVASRASCPRLSLSSASGRWAREAVRQSAPPQHDLRGGGRADDSGPCLTPPIDHPVRHQIDDHLADHFETLDGSSASTRRPTTNGSSYPVRGTAHRWPRALGTGECLDRAGHVATYEEQQVALDCATRPSSTRSPVFTPPKTIVSASPSPGPRLDCSTSTRVPRAPATTRPVCPFQRRLKTEQLDGMEPNVANSARSSALSSDHARSAAKADVALLGAG